MKWLSVILSMLTLYLFGSDFFINNSQNKKTKPVMELAMFIPPKAAVDKLEIEKQWHGLKEQRIAAAKAVLQPDLKAKPEIKAKVLPTLTIAGIKYQLLGIFKTGDNPFILLKTKSEQLKQVPQGTEISPGVILTSVSSDKITLTTTEKTIEFKLFERDNNV